VISAFNSKPERIRGSRLFQAYLGILEPMNFSHYIWQS